MPAAKAEEIKQRALALLGEGQSVRAVAATLGVGKSTVAEWKLRLGDQPGHDFHGNQYTGGISNGDTHPSIDSAHAALAAAGFTRTRTAVTSMGGSYSLTHSYSNPASGGRRVVTEDRSAGTVTISEPKGLMAEPQFFGDAPGHDFHGNQWVAGSSGPPPIGTWVTNTWTSPKSKWQVTHLTPRESGGHLIGARRWIGTTKKLSGQAYIVGTHGVPARENHLQPTEPPAEFQGAEDDEPGSARFGDQPGHDFHGNQYVAGSGGGLTADEQDMVRRYGGMDYTAINAVLRGDKAGFTPGQVDFINKQVGLIDSAMAKSTLTKDTTVYRELPREAAMKEAGTTVISPAYVSTTYDRESAIQHRDDNTKLNPARGYEVLQATLPAGTHAIDMQAQVGSKDEFAQSRQSVEKEIVVARNTPIRWELVAKMAESDDDPGSLTADDSLIASGLVVKAQDTGRVLMLQRSFENPEDPAAGNWEFPGGHLEKDADALATAKREWGEELGLDLPGGEVAGSWISPNGIYQGFLYLIPEEAAVDLANRDTSKNPDGDTFEAAAWWAAGDVPGMPALRSECLTSDWNLILRASEQHFGDEPGHPFRGNQWATGSGGDGNEKWGKVPGGIAGGKAGDFHGWSGLTPDQNQQRLATIHGLSPNRVSYNGGRGWYDLGTGMSLGPRPDDKAWAASQKWSPQADGLIQTAMQNVKDTGMGEDHPQFWTSVRQQATTEAGSRGIKLAESTAPSGGNGDVVIEPDDIVRAPEMEHQGSRPEPHVHDPDDPLPVLVFDLHGTITKTNGFPLIFPPYPLIKEYMDKMAARGACIHIATAGLDELDELVNDARLDEIWRFCDFYALPVSHIGPKANAHVFYDDRMIEVDRDDPHWDQYALQAEELMLLKFDLDPDTGKYVRKDREKTGDPIKEFPSLEESPPDRPRGFTSPILEVDVHRCISYASGSQRTAPLKPGAKEIITQLYNAGYTIQVGCAGWNPATHPRDVWEGRYGAQGQYLYEQGIPFDRRVSKDHGDLFHDDKGLRHTDWYADFPRLLAKLHGPSPEHNIPLGMAEKTTRVAVDPEKTDQMQDPQHRKRNQTEGDEPRSGRTAASFERTGPARNEDSPSTPTEPGALQSDSRAMVQERGSQDEKSGTGLPRGESEEVRDVSALGGLPADREMGQTPVDLGLHDHPVLNRLYIEAMNRYANLINNGVARHHALAAVKRIDPDFYIQEAQHAWLYTQLANRAKGQKGHAPSDTDKPDAGPGLPSLGGTPMLAKMGEFDREGLALAIQAFEASGRREPGLLNMGWSPSQPTPPPHVTSVYDQFEWEAGDTQALSDYLANLYREQYLETLNDHLTRSGVAQVSEITDPSVLASLDARAEEVAAGVGDTFNNDLANQTYLTWIDQRSELGTQSSRYTLEQEIDGWANDRADWKADQITSTEAGWATHQAADDFLANNPGAASTGHVEGPDPAAEPDCQELLDRGTMDAEELAAIDFPIHPNCEHYPVYDIEQDWGSNQDVWSAQASPDDTSGDEIAAAELKMGDQPGHEFHGNQWVAGAGGGGTPAQQAALGSFERTVAAEERARVKTDYRYGPERGIMVDPAGKVVWEGGSGESAHISNIPAAAYQPGNILTHFHPDTGPAWLSTRDVDLAMQNGITMRAFTASGHWQEFTPSRLSNGLGITGEDLYRQMSREGLVTSDNLPARWTAALQDVIGDRGTIRSGGPEVKADELAFGDVPGHDFHGNQYVSGSGGGSSDEEEKSTATVTPQSDDAAALFTKAKREAEQRNWNAQNARDFLNRDFHSQGEIATHLRDAHKIDPNHHLDPNLQLAHARLHSPAYEAIAPPNHTHDLSRRDLALAASELPALFGDVAGHDFHGNQYVAGSGGVKAAADMNMQAWAHAVADQNANMTIGEKQDAFYVYDAESEVSMHFENSGNVYVHPEDAKAYADKLAAQYVPGAKVAFNPSADLEGDAGETTLLAKPDSYRIDVDHAWLSQAVICHEMAHVMATEKVGQIGHGASFREAWMTILQGEMPDLASKIGAELAKSPPAVTLAEIKVALKARVTTPQGKSVTCFAPAEFTPRKPLQMGDAPGHDFHGNQWTGGIGGGGDPASTHPRLPAELTARLAEGRFARDQMPVVPSQAAEIQQFVDNLNQQGVESRLEQVDPRSLTPTQNELDPVKVNTILDDLRLKAGADDRTMVISKDSRILDGHHRWGAHVMYAMEHPGHTVRALRVNTEIDQLLADTREFNQTHGLVSKSLLAKTSEKSPPDPTQPYVWIDGQWVLVASDDSDGVPRKLKFGDVPGHDFHGNQYTGGIGGGATGASGNPLPPTVAPAVEAANLALTFQQAASAHEKEVTAELQNLATAIPGAKLQGLDFRLKSASSMARKIGADAAYKGIPQAQAAGEIHDALRYTMTIPSEVHLDGINRALDGLREKGYTVDKVKNFWKEGNDYHGVNAQILTRDGYGFELQFHTPESYNLKEYVNHPLYERARDVTISQGERDQLIQQMADNTSRLITPTGILALGTLK